MSDTLSRSDQQSLDVFYQYLVENAYKLREQTLEQIGNDFGRLDRNEYSAYFNRTSNRPVGESGSTVDEVDNPGRSLNLKSADILLRQLREDVKDKEASTDTLHVGEADLNCDKQPENPPLPETVLLKMPEVPLPKSALINVPEALLPESDLIKEPAKSETTDANENVEPADSKKVFRSTTTAGKKIKIEKSPSKERTVSKKTKAGVVKKTESNSATKNSTKKPTSKTSATAAKSTEVKSAGSTVKTKRQELTEKSTTRKRQPTSSAAKKTTSSKKAKKSLSDKDDDNDEDNNILYSLNTDAVKEGGTLHKTENLVKIIKK